MSLMVQMHSARYSRQILMQFDFSRYIFQKSSNIKSHESPSSGSKAVPCAHTETETESANSRFSQFCEGA